MTPTVALLSRVKRLSFTTMAKVSAKPKSSFSFAVNKLRIKLLWLEVEGEGVIPVAGALILCFMLMIWIIF
jgi:hypothetical protein